MLRSLLTLGLLLGAPLAAQAADTCDNRAARVGRRLAAVPFYLQLQPPKRPVDLPQLSGAPVGKIGPTVDVKAGRYVFQRADQPLAELADLSEELDGVSRAEELTSGMTSPVYVRLDRAERAQPALPLLCRVAEQRELYLLVEDPKQPRTVPYTPPAPPKQLVGVLEQVDAMPGAVEKAAALGNLLEQAIGKCKALTDRFQALNEVPPFERPAKMRTAVPEGLRACKCVDADVDAVEALLLKILAPTQPPAFAIRLNLACGKAKGETVKLSTKASGQDLARAAAQTRGPVRFAFE